TLNTLFCPEYGFGAYPSACSSLCHFSPSTKYRNSYVFPGFSAIVFFHTPDLESFFIASFSASHSLKSPTTATLSCATSAGSSKLTRTDLPLGLIFFSTISITSDVRVNVIRLFTQTMRQP